MSRSGIFGSNRGSARHDVVSSGLVVFNVDSSASIAEYRLSSAAADPTKNYWGPLLGKGPDANHRLHIRPWQLLLTHRRGGAKAMRDAVQSTNGRNIANLRMPVFSSFNLYPKKSASAIYDEIEALGFAADWMVYGEPTQIDSGLACVVSGSFTTTNTGVSNWTPGMLLKWTPPPSDPAELDTYITRRRNAHAVTPEYPENYFPAVLEPFEFETDVRQSIKRRLQKEFDKMNAPGGFDSYTAFADLDVAGKEMDGDRAFFMRRLRSELARFVLLTAATGGGASLLGKSGIAGNGGADRSFVMAVAQTMINPRAPGSSQIPVRLLEQADSDTFALECEAIHRAAQVVVGKSIGFALPGAGGDIVL